MVEELKNEDLKLYQTLMEKVFLSEFVTDNYKADNYKVLVIKEDNKIVASLTYYKIKIFTTKRLELSSLAVDPDYRGKKYADKLFEYLLEYAKANYYSKIYVSCNKEAKAAHALYNKYGFKEEDSLRFGLELEISNDACRIN